MATYNKYNCFVEDLAEGKHDFSANAFKVALTNRVPVATTDRVLVDIVELSAINGYPAGGVSATVSSSVHTAGVYKVIFADPSVFTASGGAIGPFRYAVLYNSTPAGGLVVAYWDYLQALTLNSGETFSVDFNQTAGVFTVT